MVTIFNMICSIIIIIFKKQLYSLRGSSCIIKGKYRALIITSHVEITLTISLHGSSLLAIKKQTIVFQWLNTIKSVF